MQKPIEMMTINELVDEIPESTLIALVMRLTGGSANPNVIANIRASILGIDLDRKNAPPA